MKKGLKVATASFLAVAAIAPITAAAAEQTTVADGVYVEGKYYTGEEFAALSAAEKKALIKTGIKTKTFVFVSGGKVYDVANPKVLLADSNETFEAAAYTYAQYVEKTGNELSTTGGIVAEDKVTELKVTSVSAITATSVTVAIDAPTEDLADQTVVVKDGAGKEYAVQVATIKAGATTATFNFVTPLTVNPTDAWTVNGVAYEVEDLAITKVETVDKQGKYLNVQFSKKVSSLDASELTLRATVSQQAYGVESVRLSADGYSAQVTVIGNDTLGAILTSGREYTLTITKAGETVSANFEVPNFDEDATVISYNAVTRTIVLDNNARLVVPTTTAVDFENLVGQNINVWSNKDNVVTRYDVLNNTVKFDAIKLETRNNGTFVKLVTEGKEYRIADKDVDTISLTNTGYVRGGVAVDTLYESAKVVIDAQGQVKNIVAVDTFSAPILVESVSGNIIKGNATEYNLKDVTVVKDGKTIALADLKAGDVVYYNNAYKYAEVYNGSVTGEITSIFDGEFIAGGKTFKTVGKAIINGKYVDLNKTRLEEFQASGKAVTVYVDRTGTVEVVTGEVGVVKQTTTFDYALTNSDTFKEAINTLGYVKTINHKGETAELKIDATKLKTINDGSKVYSIGVDPYTVGTKAKDQTSTVGTAVTGFRLLGTGVVEYSTKDAANNVSWTAISPTIDFDGTTVGVVDGSDAIAKAEVVSITKDDAGNVVGINFAPATKQSITTGAGETITDMSVKTIKNKQVTAETPAFIVDGDDVKATTWGEAVKGATSVESFDIYHDGKDVQYIVLDKADIAKTPETIVEEMVVEKISFNKDDASKVAYIKLASKTEGSAAVEYKLNTDTITAAGVTNGDIVTVTLTKEDNKVVTIAKESTAVTKSIDTTNTTSINGNEITFADGSEVEAAAAGLKVYEVIKNDAGEVVRVDNVGIKGLQTIKADNALQVSYLDGNTSYVDTIVITKNADTATTPTTPAGSLTVDGGTDVIINNAAGANKDVTISSSVALNPSASFYTTVTGSTVGNTVTVPSTGQLKIAFAAADINADQTVTVKVLKEGLVNGTADQTVTFTLKANVVKVSGTVAALTAKNASLSFTAATSKTYEVTVDGVTHYVKADGTLSTTASDAASTLTGTVTVSGLTNGKTYTVVEK